MKATRFPSRWSFQAKVLTPVVAVVIAVVSITIWMVNHHVSAQFETDAAQALLTSDAVFQNLQRIRAKNLFLRFGNVPNEPRFKAVAQSSEANAMNSLLRELVAEVGAQYITYAMWNGQQISAANKTNDPGTTAFQNCAIENTGRVLQGQTVFTVAVINGRIVDVVSMPVVVGVNTVGALSLGTELGDEVAREFFQLTRCHVVFYANGQITATTIPRAKLNPATAHHIIAEPAYSGDTHLDPAEQVEKLKVAGEHMLCVAGRFKGAGKERALGYVLLASYEQPLAALFSMQQMLLLIGGISVVLATLVVWAAVRRVTQPLRQLRDVAVAIGQGDFSQRVDVRTADECGQLATAFNRMIQNLATAREQLERTVETLRSTRAQLTQSEKLSAVGEFVAGVAHELNNPLTSVIGFSELLQRANLDDRHRRQLEMIASESHRCHKIVQSLLSFARQHKSERTPVDLNTVIDSALDILGYQMRTSNIRLERRLAAPLPAVIADDHQLQQVIINMLNNARQAVEAHRPDGWVGIATRATTTHVEISIRDNGPGIPEENLGKIFDPFFTTKEVGKGTGLGLSLCYGIIQEHGGTIQVHSAPNEGATFIITLPIATDLADVDNTITHAKPAVLTPSGHGKRVLIVDDEEGILNLTREVLTADQYQVDIAGDGDTALKKADATRYDVIICDWKMPGLNGRQVYEHLCVFNPEAAKRFIFMTGDVISDTTREFLEQHNRQCLSKPFSLSDFGAAINQILAASRN